MPETSDPTETLSVKKQLIVDAPAERCFRVFTANMTTWWPKTHHIGDVPLKTCVVEPRVGGRWYEIREDDTETTWGKVLAWEPPTRLVLAWQLNASYAYDAALITEVELRFTPLSPTRTQVDFEHKNLQRFGAGATKQATDMDRGWGMILDGFGRAAHAAT